MLQSLKVYGMLSNMICKIKRSPKIKLGVQALTITDYERTCIVQFPTAMMHVCIVSTPETTHANTVYITHANVTHILSARQTVEECMRNSRL